MTASESSDGETTLVWAPVEGTVITFADGTSNPPPMLPPSYENLNRMGPGVLFIGLFFASLVLALSVAMSLWTYVKRESRVVRSAQPEFLFLLCVGTFIMGCSIIPMSLQEPTSQTLLNMACMADIWLFMLGFAFSFSALLAKMQRINKIFLAGKFKRVVVQPRDVMMPFFSLLVANLIILVSWTIVAPLSYRRVPSAFDQFGRPVASYGICQVDDFKTVLPFITPLTVLNLACVFFANVQAYRARKIRTEFSESKFIAISMASILQAFVLGIPVFAAVMMNPNPSGIFLLKASVVSLICLAILLFMFVPKLRAYKNSLSLRPARERPPSGVRVYGGSQRTRMAAIERDDDNDAVPQTKSFIRRGRLARQLMGHGSVFDLRRTATASTVDMSHQSVGSSLNMFGSVRGSFGSLRSALTGSITGSLRASIRRASDSSRGNC